MADLIQLENLVTDGSKDCIISLCAFVQKLFLSFRIKQENIKVRIIYTYLNEFNLFFASLQEVFRKICRNDAIRYLSF